MDVLCRVEMLGGLRVLQGDRTITRFGTQKNAALLAYLAYHLDRAHPREVLVELIWPWSAPAAGRHSLRTALASLRRQLEPPGVPVGSVVVTDPFSAGLSAGTVTTDVGEFEAALAAVEAAGSDLQRRQHLQSAVDLYQGLLLPGFYQDWVLPEQRRLAELYCQAVRGLTAALAETGNLEQALEYARRATTVDPLHEECQCGLMRLLDAAGQPGAALRQYQELQRALREQLGEAPSPTAQRLAQEIASRSKARTPATRSRPSRPTRRRAPAVAPGTGTVTVLATDTEARPRREQRKVLRTVFEEHGGELLRELPDGFAVSFTRATDAATCAVACQQALSGAPSGKAGKPRTCIALHTGEVGAGDSGPATPLLDEASAVVAAGHGGQVLCSEATAGLLHGRLPAGWQVADLGSFRLPTLDNVQRLWQVTWPEMQPETFPALRAERAYGGRLPPLLTRFFGRGEELARLQELLLSDNARLVALTGPGGSGKTRLALEAARLVLEPLKGAVWFVPLQELADPALIPGAIIDGLGLPRATDADPLEQATVFLSRQPSLLVVDNLEHLLEEGVAPLVTLLGRVPHLTCLATSRQPLGVSGEQELLVAPLPTPAADTAPEALIECPSVQLFVDRAQSARPDFQVTARNAEAVAELCNRLEGIPLAVELAAARTRALTPAQMLAHMGDRFALLVSRRRGVPDRHRTLWAAIDWSYQLLAPELRRFFARLSIFRGGWTAEAAQAVCRESRAAEYLERLLEASLVSAEPGDEALGMRFAMFETLREYGDGKLLAREREPLARRHAEYCTTLVTEASREWQGPAGGIWFRRVEADYANIRQALARLQRADQATATELALVAGTKAFWDTRRDWEEGLAYDSAALARCGSEVSINRWRICNNAANLAGAVGRRALARSFAEQGMELARQLHHDGAMAGALYRAADFADDLAVKRQLIAEALRIARRTHDHDGLVSGLGRVAGLMEAQGQWQKARALLTRILALQRERGMGLGVASALEGLARIARAERDYTRGRELLRESLAIHRELGIQPHVVPTLAELSLLAHFDGDLDEARALGEEALEGARAAGHKREIRGALRNLSNVARQQGDCPAARALIEESLSLSRELRDNWWISMGLYCLGLVALQEGDDRAAYSALAESLTLRRQSNDMPYIAFTLEGFAALYAAQGRAPLAAQLLGAAEGVREAAPVPVLPPELRDAERETALETVRAALSDTEFAAEWAAGRAMGLDEAIRCALSPPDATPPAKPPRPRKRAPTRRRAPQP